MVKTISINVQIPTDRHVELTLPEDMPVGPAKITVDVVVPDMEGASLSDLRNSEFFGMWKDRTDIVDSSEFARKLREESWKRSA